MDESEFRRLLDLFPVVRSRDFVAESQSSRQSASNAEQKELKEWQDAWQDQNDTEIEIQGLNQHDTFWNKLKLAAEKKMGSAEAERFCKNFQKIHNKLVCPVYEELSPDAALNLLKLSINSGE